MLNAMVKGTCSWSGSHSHTS